MHQKIRRGGQWKRAGAEVLSFPSSHLSREAKTWHYFMGGRLMPTSNMSTVTKKRAVLLHTIVTEKKINICKILHKEIMSCATTSTPGLFFPSLITAICQAAGTPWETDEGQSLPRHVIDDAHYLTFRDGPEVSQPEPERAQEGESDSGIMQTILSRLDTIEKKQDHVIKCFDVMGRMYYQWVSTRVPRFSAHEILHMPVFSDAGASTSHNQSMPATDDQPPMDEPVDESEADTDEIAIVEADGNLAHVARRTPLAPHQSRRSSRISGQHWRRP